MKYFALLVVLLVGCAISPFQQDLQTLAEIDAAFDSSVKQPPATVAEIEQLVEKLEAFQTSNEATTSLIEFRLAFLEAERLHAEGWKFGARSTTVKGFGCSMLDEVTESSELRIASAEKGNEAIVLLESFIENFPEEAETVEVTQKDALELKATFLQIEEQAVRDAKVIKSACKE